MQRIISTLLEEFHACLDQKVPAILNLIACVKGGKPTPDMLKLCTGMDESYLYVHDSKRKKFKSLCVALSLALPSLSQVNIDLLLGTYQILDKCPWGSGKGYALPSVLRSCSVSGALKQREIDEALLKSSQALERSGEGEFDDDDDALFAMMEISKFLSFPKSKRDDTVLEKVCLTLRRGSNEGHASFDSRASANIVVCALLGSIPALGNGPSLLDSSQLHPETRKDRVLAVKELLIELATNIKDVKCCDAATIGMGILCSMKNPVYHNTTVLIGSPGSTINLMGNTGGGMPGRKVDMNSMPQAKEGTLIGEILSNLKSCLDRRVETNVFYIPRFFQCLHGTPLPGPFAKIAEALLAERFEGGNTLKMPCMKLLSSQIKDRQRSGLDDRDFINLMLYITKLSVPAFHSLLGRGSEAAEMFMSLMEYALPKFPSGTVEQATMHLWEICHKDLIELKSVRCSIALITSFGRILEKARNGVSKKGRSIDMIAPVIISTLQKIVVDTLFPALCNTVKVPGMQTSLEGIHISVKDASSVWSAYNDCLCEVPLLVLRDKKFFLFDDCIDFKGICTNIAKVYLVSCFEAKRHSKAKSLMERSKAQAWISRQQLLIAAGEETVSTQLHSMRLSLFDIAHATSQDSSDIKRNVILHAFEVILVGGLSSISLEQLAVQVGFWWEYRSDDVRGTDDHNAWSHLSSIFARASCKSYEFSCLPPDGILEIVSMFLKDLPWKLCHLCRNLGISENIVNTCSRIITEYSDKAVSHHLLVNEYFSCLNTFVSCRMDSAS
mmetsp:Transcript_16082/g.23032  ORF Transcript_16082/g.23032 Transcript_16082/m.23032 type:complete len:783 (-) Transcript_16082:405-2753(-)